MEEKKDSKKKKLVYEIPKLVNISGSMGTGDCEVGSGERYCNPGTSAFSSCDQGTAALGDCPDGSGVVD
jgi:hypothetical protein